MRFLIFIPVGLLLLTLCWPSDDAGVDIHGGYCAVDTFCNGHEQVICLPTLACSLQTKCYQCFGKSGKTLCGFIGETCVPMQGDMCFCSKIENTEITTACKCAGYSLNAYE